MKFPTIKFGKRTKVSSDALAKLAAHILAGGGYREADVLALAGSVVSQSERPKKTARKSPAKRRSK